MPDQPPDDTDGPIEDASTETSVLSTTPTTSPNKVPGSFDAEDGLGVPGQNDADSVTPVGVQGTVPKGTDSRGRRGGR